MRPTVETRYLSALINANDLTALFDHGINPEMFVAHRSEYDWVASYATKYAKLPSQESFCGKFPDFVFSTGYVDLGFAVDDLKDDWHRRTLVSTHKAVQDALRNGDTKEAYELMVAAPPPVVQQRVKNLLYDESILEAYTKERKGATVPWKTLQKETGGPSAGDSWVVAARLGQGKSWTLSAIARAALLEGKDVLYCSLEMPKEQILPRIHAMLAKELGFNITHSDLHGRTADPLLYRKLLRAIKDNIPGKLYVLDTSQGSVSTTTVASLSKGMDLALVDYIGLMTSNTGSRAIEDWRVAAAISNTLKEIAIGNNVPIISAAQINRDGDDRGMKPPSVKHLAQTDAIGQDADVVLTMKKRSRSVAIYSIEKNRHGESGALFQTRFWPNIGDFREIDNEQAVELIQLDEEKEEL